MTTQLQYVQIYTECLLNPAQIIKSYKPLLLGLSQWRIY